MEKKYKIRSRIALYSFLLIVIFLFTNVQVGHAWVREIRIVRELFPLLILAPICLVSSFMMVMTGKTKGKWIGLTLFLLMVLYISLPFFVIRDSARNSKIRTIIWTW
jgi:hypothetical protein